MQSKRYWASSQCNVQVCWKAGIEKVHKRKKNKTHSLVIGGK